MGADNFEFCTLEWIWDTQQLRCDLPDGSVDKDSGSYEKVVEMLNKLGKEGWGVASTVSSSNWLFWTLQRKV